MQIKIFISFYACIFTAIIKKRALTFSLPLSMHSIFLYEGTIQSYIFCGFPLYLLAAACYSSPIQLFCILTSQMFFFYLLLILYHFSPPV